MELLVIEEFTDLNDNIEKYETVFKFNKNKTGGTLVSGIDFVSELGKGGKFSVFLVKQIEENLFEEYDSREIKLGQTAVFNPSILDTGLTIKFSIKNL